MLLSFDVWASANVFVAFVPELPTSRASRATRWLWADKALVQLSLRYKTNDHLWLTFVPESLLKCRVSRNDQLA